tara:strand:+ start:745 stop:1161 length:417 start_codon:yes stop_codon:yes gene_type:complete
MNETIKEFLNKVGIEFENVEQLDGQLIPRDILLNTDLYEEIKKDIPELKKLFSSSSHTSLHKNAEESQKWPIINITRQILKSCNFDMEPIRKSDGKTKDGKKRFKRYFKISKINKTKDAEINVIEKDEGYEQYVDLKE